MEKPGSLPILSCPRCDQQALIEHFVQVPKPLAKRGPIRFRTDGSPDIDLEPVIKATCASGHSIQGPVEAYEEKSVETFMAQVEEWNRGYSSV